jgi:hypothetical protein
MAFGSLRGTVFTANAASITDPFDTTGSQAVSVGDLIVFVLGQQTARTVDTVADNLDANNYTPLTAGTDPGTSTCRAYFKIATVAGTLTTITAQTTGSTNNVCTIAGVFEGPFVAIDANPAENNNTDNTSPFTCPSTGVLNFNGSTHELVVCWATGTGNTAYAATSPNLLAGNSATASVMKVALGYQVVTATTAVAPEFTAAANPTDSVQGTASFRSGLDVFPQRHGFSRRAVATMATVAAAWVAAAPHPQVGAKFSPALFEVAAATPDEPPGGYSPKIVSIDDLHPPQRGAQIAPLLEQPVVVDDKIPYRQPSLAYWVPEYVAPQVGAKMAPLLEQQAADKTPYQSPPDVTLHWIPSYVQPQRLVQLTPPPVYLTPGNEDEPPGGSSVKIVSIDDPPLPQVGARVAALLYEPPPVVTDDPPFRYRRFQWGEGPAVVTEISFGSIIEPVDLPPRFRPFQDTSLWQPGPPEPIVHKKVPNAFLHLLIEDNHEPPGGSSPKIVALDDPPLPQVSGKIAAALYVPPVVDDPPRLKHRQLQDRSAWQPPPPPPTLSGKLHADVLHVEPAAEEEQAGGGWFVTGHLGKPRGGVVKRIIDDGETDDERRQRVFKEILGDLEQVVEDKKPVKVAQAVKAIKRIAKQAPQDTTRSDELIKALRRAEAARAEADRIEQLRIAMAIAHDIERALMAAAMLKYQNEQALIALLLAD